MDSLPNCVLLIIISHLSIKQISFTLTVSKRWKDLCLWAIERRKSLVITGRRFRETDDQVISYFNQKDVLSIRFPIAIDSFKNLFREIRSLALGYTNSFENKHLYLVGKYLPNLKKLWLEDHNVTDDSLTELFQHCGKLETLMLHAPFITGSCFRFLPTIKHFRFYGCCFENENIEILYETLSSDLKTFATMS
ncbi:hypothetical protein B4U80_13852 [Leptotrombidium deliense]|uniref:F-box domain-containing protein n=1 Tax=Leptotrombidium deliense TaxID=299467 RepID=A0A443SB75_9ACAR|nr:hypothetical protein B4U80_13852 [Leptotrombidium deliense]